MPLQLHSPAFESGDQIPVQFTCEGANVSPPLRWSGVPQGTESFVLVVEDPDAPGANGRKTTWVHWILYDIPADVHSTEEDDVPQGAKCGKNDWMRHDYGGPCPPFGQHRYFFRLYAIDRFIANFKEPTKAQILKAIDGHVLDEAFLVGKYQRTGRIVIR